MHICLIHQPSKIHLHYLNFLLPVHLYVCSEESFAETAAAAVILRRAYMSRKGLHRDSVMAARNGHA